MAHRRIPCITIATLLSLAACTSTRPSAVSTTSTTAAVRAEPPVPPVDDKALVRAALNQWRTLTAGHTVAYTASSECIICSTPGRWKVVERDGSLVSAEPLDGQDPTVANLVPTVSEVLSAAAAAKGNANASVSATHVFVAFDPDPQVSDDEGDITAENIVIS